MATKTIEDWERNDDGSYSKVVTTVVEEKKGLNDYWHLGETDRDRCSYIVDHLREMGYRTGDYPDHFRDYFNGRTVVMFVKRAWDEYVETGNLDCQTEDGRDVSPEDVVWAARFALDAYDSLGTRRIGGCEWAGPDVDDDFDDDDWDVWYVPNQVEPQSIYRRHDPDR